MQSKKPIRTNSKLNPPQNIKNYSSKTQPINKFLEHRKKRYLETRRIFIFQLLRLLLGALIISVLVWIVVYSPLFRISEVEIIGLENHDFPTFITKDDFEPIVTQIKSKNEPSLLVFSTKKTEDGIKNRFPTLQTVSVSKIWPNKIVIIANNRKPFAKFNNMLIDVEGVSLGVAKDEDNYPVLNVPENAKDDSLKILNALEKDDFKIKEMRSTTIDDITAVLENNLTVVVGNIHKMTLKLADIHRIIDADILGDKKTIDVSSPTSPVIR